MDKFTFFNAPARELYYEGNEEEHLHTLFTDLGEKSVYDSVCQCNRCSYCARACPTNLLGNMESYSARGRNQAVRLVMESKLDPHGESALAGYINTCMLCGACTRDCFAKVPTAEHVLEYERAYAKRRLPAGTKALFNFSCSFPKLFGVMAVFYKALTLLGLKKIPFFKLYNMALAYTPDSGPLRFLFKKDKAEGPFKFIYLPSFGAKFICPSVGENTRAALERKGKTKTVFYTSGLFEYIYGSLQCARKRAGAVIREYLKIASGEKDAKLVTDSIEVYVFIKKYPQLFNGTEEFENAKILAENTLFIADILSAEDIALPAGGNIVLSKTAALECEDGLFAGAAKLLQSAAGARYKKTWDGQGYGVPGPGYSFIHKDAAQKIIKQKIRHIAAAQADTAIFCSVLQKKTLLFSSKNLYPKGMPLHIAETVKK